MSVLLHMDALVSVLGRRRSVAFYSPACHHGAFASWHVASQLLTPKTPVRLCEGVIAAAMDDYRSAFAVAQSHPWSRAPPTASRRRAPCTVRRNRDWSDWRGLAFHAAWHDDVL